VHEGTLGAWVNNYRADHAGDEPPLTLSERARLRELERKTRELPMKTEFLGKPRPSSRRSIGEREVRVHRCGEGHVPDRENVWVAGRFHLRVLWLAYSGSVGDHPTPRAVGRACAGGFDESDGTYGYRRIHAALTRQGDACGPELVRSIVRELGLVPCQPRPWRPTTTQPGAGAEAVPDLVGRDFTADEPGTKTVGDITYLPTWQGFSYLATVIDCRTKECIGYAIAGYMRTELVVDGLRTAARNVHLEPGAIFHTDRGSLSQAFAAATVFRVIDGHGALDLCHSPRTACLPVCPWLYGPGSATPAKHPTPARPGRLSDL
jgi:hypothetical protein